MCVANVMSRKERLTELFHSMRFFYDSVIPFTKQCSSPSEHFALNALRLVRTVGIVRLDEVL